MNINLRQNEVSFKGIKNLNVEHSNELFRNSQIELYRAYYVTINLLNLEQINSSFQML